MNEKQNNKLDIEDQLANFTDLILEKTAKKDENPFAPDPELRALEETVLRLKKTFQEDRPNEAILTRMHKNIVTQWQQEKNRKSEHSWEKWIPSRQKWIPQRSRQQLSMLSFAAMVLVVFFISIFFFNGVYTDQPAATGQNLTAGFLVTIIAVIVFAISFFRRNR